MGALQRIGQKFIVKIYKAKIYITKLKTYFLFGAGGFFSRKSDIKNMTVKNGTIIPITRIPIRTAHIIACKLARHKVFLFKYAIKV
jgi:hypothetical protein